MAVFGWLYCISIQEIAMGLFNNSSADHPCRFCEHWGGDVAGGSHALCVRGDAQQVQASPERGCVFWVRATGADDDSRFAMNDRLRH